MNKPVNHPLEPTDPTDPTDITDTTDTTDTTDENKYSDDEDSDDEDSDDEDSDDEDSDDEPDFCGFPYGESLWLEEYSEYEDPDADPDDDFYENCRLQSTELKSEKYQGDLLIYQEIQQEDGMILLASNCVLIADIDCGDNIDPYLAILMDYIDKNKSLFYVYKTKNGMRYIQTNQLYQGVNKAAIKVLKTLKSDEKYIKLCEKNGRFMARLTPRLDKEKISEYYQLAKDEKKTEIAVCNFICAFGGGDDLGIVGDLIRYHDLITSSFYNRPLA